ncbi:D-2-hydroxyacid dehydrogenase [Nigerium massiliense]|uniref:D-2-hydroxyacid dehydrogenase n=1 Tax=Nigerium massiliense TaxID=1522317 RepID=UPI00058CFDA6|nr:D-2-hydroxyacid dehydrogenase [Nigerium massiliense]
MAEPIAPNQTVRVVVAAPLAPELVERIAAVDPRVDVVADQDLLPPMRHPADFDGDPSWSRTPEQEARFEQLIDTADVLYGIPDVTPSKLARTVAANPKLRWVQTMAAGGGSQVVAAQLPDEAYERITFTTSAGVHGVPLAEWAIFGMFCGAKELPRLQRQQRAHAWPDRVVGHPIEGSTALVVGLGGIGQQVAKRCKALGMTVLGVKRRVSDVENVDEVHALDDLRSIVGRADHILLTLPGTPQTTHLIDAAMLAAAKRGVTVVNVGRGTVIDEAALADALGSGQVGFAALDVFEVEPLPAESPLWDLENLLVSPHSGGLDHREDERICELFCDNLRAFLDGRELRNVVDPAQGY